jgi:hypothetical protein
MASIKDLKKDIKHMVSHFIQECYVHLAYSPPLNQENVLDIISDAMELQTDMLKSINNPPLAKEKGLKTYFKNITGEFYDKIVELTERLNSLTY